MAESITVLGSTGSVGTQALEVARYLGIRVKGLAAGKNLALLMEQISEFKPDAVSVECGSDARMLEESLRGTGSNTRVQSGIEGLEAIAAIEGADMVLGAASGIISLRPILKAIGMGRDIALANKEIMVAAGDIVMKRAEEMNVRILPVDSEHSAVFQCLAANRDKGSVSRIILTASGGPFRGISRSRLKTIARDDALKHPNWKMGHKVTVDSATLMNKGFEVIEARWLFGIEEGRISVLVHPQSIVHSMVEFADSSVIAQMSVPDMRIPIQYAFTYPDRRPGLSPAPDFIKSGVLSFEEPDIGVFPCLKLAREALCEGGTMPAVLNAADDVAVGHFLNGRIGFADIPEIISKVLWLHSRSIRFKPSLEEIIEADAWGHTEAEAIIQGIAPPAG